MNEFTGLELSPKKIEYLKYIQEQKSTVKTTDISSQFKVDPSTITKTISELSATGLIQHAPYRGISLTEQGRTYAEFLIRRHRILSLVLTHYGLSADEACVAVSKFEGYVPRDVVDKNVYIARASHYGRLRKDTTRQGLLSSMWLDDQLYSSPKIGGGFL